MSAAARAWLNIIFILIALLVLSGMLVWIERRLLALWQDRYGPNRVGPFGVLRTIRELAEASCA